MRFTVSIIFLLLSFIIFPGHAAENKHSIAENNIRQVFSTLLPDEQITRIRTTPIENLYEVLIGPNVIYVSGDGRYIFKGDILDMQARENMSEIERTMARESILNSMTDNEYIDFSPANPEYLIYVFTDIDCSYCRRLHRDVPELNKHGVGVRYLAYPRGGKNSRSFDVMQSVWCSENRKQALTDAKNGKDIKTTQCDSPVEKEYLMGQKFGVRGTPAIYTQHGEELSGYAPPDQLLEVLRQQ